MAKQRRERVNRDLSYQDIVSRLGEGEDVSFERIGDTIIMRRGEPDGKEAPEETRLGYGEPSPELGAEEKLILVKKEIEKKKERGVSRKDYTELNEAFERLERRLEALEREMRGLRVDMGYLRGVMLEKLKASEGGEPVAERAEEQKVEEVAVGGSERQLRVVEEDIPEMKFEDEKRSSLGFITNTISNIYNSFFLGANESERDTYKEFQKKLFLLVRTQPRDLDEIAYGTGESRANCLIWLTRMVDEGLLEEARGREESKRAYRIVWEKVS